MRAYRRISWIVIFAFVLGCEGCSEPTSQTHNQEKLQAEIIQEINRLIEVNISAYRQNGQLRDEPAMLIEALQLSFYLERNERQYDQLCAIATAALSSATTPTVGWKRRASFMVLFYDCIPQSDMRMNTVLSEAPDDPLLRALLFTKRRLHLRNFEAREIAMGATLHEASTWDSSSEGLAMLFEYLSAHIDINRGDLAWVLWNIHEASVDIRTAEIDTIRYQIDGFYRSRGRDGSWFYTYNDETTYHCIAMKYQLARMMLLEEYSLTVAVRGATRLSDLEYEIREILPAQGGLDDIRRAELLDAVDKLKGRIATVRRLAAKSDPLRRNEGALGSAYAEHVILLGEEKYLGLEVHE